MCVCVCVCARSDLIFSLSLSFLQTQVHLPGVHGVHGPAAAKHAMVVGVHECASVLEAPAAREATLTLKTAILNPVPVSDHALVHTTPTLCYSYSNFTFDGDGPNNYSCQTFLCYLISYLTKIDIILYPPTQCYYSSPLMSSL